MISEESQVKKVKKRASPSFVEMIVKGAIDKIPPPVAKESCDVCTRSGHYLAVGNRDLRRFRYCLFLCVYHTKIFDDVSQTGSIPEDFMSWPTNRLNEIAPLNALEVVKKAAHDYGLSIYYDRPYHHIKVSSHMTQNAWPAFTKLVGGTLPKDSYAFYVARSITGRNPRAALRIRVI